MFDLEDKIREWKSTIEETRSMSHDATFELESHLRDSIAELVALGLHESEAFMIASQRLGAPRKLSEEFCKVSGHFVWRERILWMVLGFVGANTLPTTFSGFAALLGAMAAAFGFDSREVAVISMSASVLCWAVLLSLMWQAARRDRAYAIRGVVLAKWLAWLFVLNIFGHGLRVAGISMHARSVTMQEFAESIYWSSYGGFGMNFCVLVAFVAMIAMLCRPQAEEIKSIA